MVSSNTEKTCHNAIARNALNGFNTFIVTAKLSRQLVCTWKCHWWVYSSFSTCNSAVHWHHSR